MSFEKAIDALFRNCGYVGYPNPVELVCVNDPVAVGAEQDALRQFGRNNLRTVVREKLAGVFGFHADVMEVEAGKRKLSFAVSATATHSFDRDLLEHGSPGEFVMALAKPPAAVFADLGFPVGTLPAEAQRRPSPQGDRHIPTLFRPKIVSIAQSFSVSRPHASWDCAGPFAGVFRDAIHEVRIGAGSFTQHFIHSSLDQVRIQLNALHNIYVEFYIMGLCRQAGRDAR